MRSDAEFSEARNLQDHSGLQDPTGLQDRASAQDPAIPQDPASPQDHDSLRGPAGLLPPGVRANPRLFAPQPASTVPEAADFLPAPPRRKGPFQKWPRAWMVLPAAVVALVCVAVSGVHWMNDELPLATSGMSVFRDHHLFTSVTALFTHAGFPHLASNLLSLVFFGWMLFAYFGWKAFPAAPLVVGVLSNLLTIVHYDPRVELLGASGMLYGMEALWLVLFLHFEHRLPVTHRVLRAGGYVLVMLIPGSYDPNVSYLAHGTGFALGLLAGFILAPYLTVRSVRRAPPWAPDPRFKGVRRKFRAGRRSGTGRYAGPRGGLRARLPAVSAAFALRPSTPSVP